MPQRHERVFKETLYSITRTENKKNNLPGAHELVAQIDSNLRHLQGQKKILQNMKGHRTGTDKFLSSHLENKNKNKKNIPGFKPNCEHVCDDFRKLAEKKYKVADCSTQIGSSFYNPNNDSELPFRKTEKYANNRPKTIDFGQNVHLISDGSSAHTASKTNKNKTSIRKVNSSTNGNVSKRFSDQKPKRLGTLKLSLDPPQPSPRFEVIACGISHFKTRYKDRSQPQEVHTCQNKYQASKKAETYLIQQSKNLPEFLFDEKSPRDTLRTNRKNSSCPESPKNRAPTPRSIRRNHAKLSRDILDHARRIRDLEVSKNSDKQRTCNKKLKNWESISETYKRALQSEKEARRKLTKIVKDCKNLSSTYRLSKKRTEIKQTIFKHDAFINVEPEKTAHINDGIKLSRPKNTFERSKNEHQPDANEMDRSKTNDLSEDSSMTKTHRASITKLNVIDDSTYICPDNSEENDYFILPYTSKTSEDNVHLNLSPEPTIENFGKRNTFSKENTSKSVVVLEDLSSQESQIFHSLKPPRLRENEINEHHIDTSTSKRYSQNGVNNEISQQPNGEENSSRSFNKSNNISHQLEQTWESHIHRQGPFSSKFDTSHDPRVKTSSEYRSHNYNLKDQLLETNPKMPSQKHSSITPLEKKYEMRPRTSISQKHSKPLTNVSSLSRSSPYEPKGQVNDLETCYLGDKTEKQKDLFLRSHGPDESAKKDQVLEQKYKLNEASRSLENANGISKKLIPNDDDQLVYQGFSHESKETLVSVSENKFKDTLFLTHCTSASDTEARNLVFSRPQQNNKAEKSSKIQSSEFTDSSNELPVKSIILKQGEESNQKLVEDMDNKTFKTPSLQSLTRKGSELGAISKQKLPSSKHKPMVPNNNIHSPLIQKTNPTSQSSESISYELKTRNKSEIGKIFKKNTHSSASPSLHKSEFMNAVSKTKTFSTSGQDLSQSIESSNKLQGERLLLKGSELGAIPKTSANKKQLALNAMSYTTTFPLLTKQTKCSSPAREIPRNDSKPNDLTESLSFKIEPELESWQKGEPKFTQLIDRNYADAKATKSLVSSSNGSNEKFLVFDALTHKSSFTLPAKSKCENLSRKTPWSDTKINDITNGISLKLEQEQTSQEDAAKATQSIGTKFQLHRYADEKVSKSIVSLPNGPELGAISDLSINVNDLTPRSHSLPTQPKAYETQVFSQKPPKSEPTWNALTSTGGMFLDLEPNQMLEMDTPEAHQSADTKSVSNYCSDSEISALFQSDEDEIKNSLKSKKLSKNSILLSNDIKMQASESTLEQVFSQKRAHTNYSTKSLPKHKQSSSISISSKNTSKFSKHEPVPMLRASSSTVSNPKTRATSNVAPIRISKSLSSSANNLRTDITIKTELPDINYVVKESKYSSSFEEFDIFGKIKSRIANSSPQTEVEQLPSVSRVVKELANPKSELDYSSLLNLDKSSLKETEILQKSEENVFLSDSLNPNVHIEGVPLEVSEFIQHLQNRVRDCDENVKKQLEDFEKQKNSCQTVVEACKPDSSFYIDIKEDEERRPATNVEDDPIAEKLLTISAKNLSDQQVKPLCRDDASESQIDAEKSCHCIFCGKEQSTSDISEEIPSFTGCDCMKENYYKIMRIAYNK